MLLDELDGGTELDELVLLLDELELLVDPELLVEELSTLLDELEDKETLLCGFPLSLKNRLYTSRQITKNRHTTKMPATVLLRR